MYEQGDVQIAMTQEQGKRLDVEKGTIFPLAYLPHSCDEWVIGGAEQVRTLIADLQSMLREMES